MISVIVPIFNTVDYLPMCLSSILNQTYVDLEIILVDDGSTDGSGEICDAYAARDSRLKVIHQENAGVVSARNRGMKEATGEYVAFIDSDDYIEPDMMKELKRMAEESGADLVTSGHIVEYVQSAGIQGELKHDAFSEGVYGNNEKQFLYKNMICYETYSNMGILSVLWSKLFRRSLLEQNAYRISEKIKIAEDACLVYMCCMDAHSICVSHRAFYHYYARETSCMHNPDRSSFQMLDACYQSLYQKVKEIEIFQDELLRQIEMFVAREAVYCLKNRFGFSNGGVLPLYAADLKGWNADTRIILYGAGYVGSSYYQQIMALGQADIVLWVDADERVVKKNKLVEPVCSIFETEYDYIVIAVKGKKLADKINSDLQKMGISRDKIVWKVPQFVLDIYST